MALIRRNCWGSESGRTRHTGVRKCKSSLRAHLRRRPCLRDDRENTRLAISAIGECPARVVTLAAKPGTRPAVLREYTLPETMNASIDLTPDGRFLVARNNTAITVMELFDDHGQVLHTWPDDFPLPVVSPRMRIRHVAERHVAAYTTDRRVKVIHIPDGEKLLGLDFGIRPRIALSPDGGLLAIPKRSRHRIRFYQVPPAGGTPGNSGNAHDRRQAAPPRHRPCDRRADRRPGWLLVLATRFRAAARLRLACRRAVCNLRRTASCLRSLRWTIET